MKTSRNQVHIVALLCLVALSATITLAKDGKYYKPRPEPYKPPSVETDREPPDVTTRPDAAERPGGTGNRLTRESVRQGVIELATKHVSFILNRAESRVLRKISESPHAPTEEQLRDIMKTEVEKAILVASKSLKPDPRVERLREQMEGGRGSYATSGNPEITIEPVDGKLEHSAIELNRL